LVVEVLVYRLDGEPEDVFAGRRCDLIREGARLAEACGARYLKLEYPGDEQGCAALTDALSVPWALLSAGVEHDTFVAQLGIALANGAAGFIAGRSIWKESVAMDVDRRRSFLAGEARRRLEQLLEMVR
jgi:sulfofructosephosphate aldolase